MSDKRPYEIVAEKKDRAGEDYKLVRVPISDYNDLVHIMTGKIRNILANEYGMNRGTLGADQVRGAVKKLAGEEVAKAVLQQMSNSKSFKFMVEKAVKEAVADEVKRLLGEQIESAAQRIVFSMTVKQEPEPKNPNFGQF